MSVRLTVGMACYQDFHGAYFTSQSLRLHHAAALRGGEVLIVDNSPDSPDGKATAELAARWGGAGVPLRYVAAPEVSGTAAPRDRVFAEARGDLVVCLDAHVLLAPGALDALLAFFDARPRCRDLVQGPMLYDDLRGLATHFDDEWRGEMWGTWGTDPRGSDPAAPAFEIGAMGLGAFACRKDAWAGFNPAFREFGGEEWYLHEKFRKRGDKAWCLPGFRWLHRFGRPGGPPYPLSRESKVRNYVLGHRELGVPLDRCRAHFVGDGRMRAEDFDAVVAAVDGAPAAPTTPAPQARQPGGCGCRAGSAAPPPGSPPPADYAAFLAKAVAHDPPLAALSDLAKGRARVVEFSEVRAGPSIAFLAARPARIDSHATNVSIDPATAERTDGPTLVALGDRGSLATAPAECDLLYLGERLGADGTYAALVRHAPSCSGRVVLGNLAGREESERAGGPGPMPGVRRFLSENPEWTVLSKPAGGMGYLVLTRRPEDRKQPPPLWKQGWNVLKAGWRAGANVTKAGPLVGTPAQERRLALCTVCESRNEASCGECGCQLDLKTSWPTEFCPLGVWHAEPGPS